MPTREAHAVNRGVRLAYQMFGTGPQTVLLVPGWQIAHSRVWKFQVPYLAERFRVVTFDARGSGRSDRPDTGYDHDTLAADALAVMNAAGIDRAALVGWSGGVNHAIMLAAAHPDRVTHLILINGAPSQATGPERAQRRQEVMRLFHQPHDRYTGWAKLNANYFRQDYAGWIEFFVSQMLPERHSTKAIADATAWGLDGDPEILIRTRDEWWSETPFPELMARIHVPTLIVHGTDDRAATYAANAPFLQRTIPASALVDPRRLRARPPPSRLRPGQPADPRLRRHVPHPRPLGARADGEAEGPLGLFPDRTRTRPAGSRDRPRTAPAPARTGGPLAGRRSRAVGSGAGGGDDPPGQRQALQRIGPHRGARGGP